MIKKPYTIAAASILALAASGGMAAALTASATSDLNLRAGPGPQYNILDVIQSDESVMVSGCLSTQDWCEVNNGDAQGWAYAPYLMFDDEGTAKPLPEMTAQTVTVIEDTGERDEATAVMAGAGALAGALIAGPVGAVVGGMVSGIAANATVDPEVTYYITENPVEPVFLTGEPVVGAAVPADVMVYDVPQASELAYLNVNGDLVVVERESRRIVQVVR
ncbi:DUF1236 domain-containing protein [Pararhodobacter zhoushanensis]|uniref:DUF1236 domain-containing protein n=1 Tax=Pararhodobacter zhoushanensis TaxID=2479545 RepID=A0ABT3H3T3_9RHOB|nr:DUF1236 domain-containing protein [Pararhodobacter zhoushanensis]MCW1934476.1 DUF1236 domain-containing protein [Pararhodobacter zhoushanensis]